MQGMKSKLTKGNVCTVMVTAVADYARASGYNPIFSF